MKPISRGAEAKLYLEGGKLVKTRVEKPYRERELDLRLRRTRTQREAKLLENARRVGLNVPRLYSGDPDAGVITMEYLQGRTLKDVIEESGAKEAESFGKKIGEILALMHESNIVHNDLTTSNMILCVDGIYLIDFGLGATSTRIEDKAMDLVVLKKALNVTHTKLHKPIWEGIVASYRKKSPKAKETLTRVETIERRVRYFEAG